jgi:hypothetical protein
MSEIMGKTVREVLLTDLDSRLSVISKRAETIGRGRITYSCSRADKWDDSQGELNTTDDALVAAGNTSYGSIVMTLSHERIELS